MTKPVSLFLSLLWLHACHAFFPDSLTEVWPEHHPALCLLILPQVQRTSQSREMESLGCMVMTDLLKPFGPVASISTENLCLLFQPQVLSECLCLSADLGCSVNVCLSEAHPECSVSVCLSVTDPGCSVSVCLSIEDCWFSVSVQMSAADPVCSVSACLSAADCWFSLSVCQQQTLGAQ